VKGIQDMLDKDKEFMTVYDYQAGNYGGLSPDPQTYLIKYKIAELNLDLGESIGDVALEQTPVSITVPDLTAFIQYGGGVSDTNPLYLSTETIPVTRDKTPLVTINLGADLGKLIQGIRSDTGALGLSFDGDVTGKIRVAIPAWEIGSTGDVTSWSQGVVVGGKTNFFNTAPIDWVPSNTIEVYVAIIDNISNTTISPAIQFDWTYLTIAVPAAASDSLKGDFPLDLSSLKDTLGTLNFTAVDAYVYISNLPKPSGSSKSKLKLTYTPATPAGSAAINITGTAADGYVEIDDAVVTDAELENDTWKPEDHPSSLSRGISFVPLFSAGKATLSYEIEMRTLVISKAQINGGANKEIVVDIVIKLPLSFTVGTAASDKFDKFKTGEYSNGFVQLDLAALSGMGGTSGTDLLGRTKDGDDMFGDIEYLKIWVLSGGYKNNFIDGLILGVYNEEPVKKEPDDVYVDILDLDLLKQGSNQSITLTPTYPFNPQFEILIKRPSAGASGTISVPHQEEGKNPELDFNIAVEAKTTLDYTTKF
jgi:hypothetical protein